MPGGCTLRSVTESYISEKYRRNGASWSNKPMAEEENMA